MKCMSCCKIVEFWLKQNLPEAVEIIVNIMECACAFIYW